MCNKRSVSFQMELCYIHRGLLFHCYCYCRLLQLLFVLYTGTNNRAQFVFFSLLSYRLFGVPLSFVYLPSFILSATGICNLINGTCCNSSSLFPICNTQWHFNFCYSIRFLIGHVSFVKVSRYKKKDLNFQFKTSKSLVMYQKFSIFKKCINKIVVGTLVE